MTAYTTTPEAVAAAVRLLESAEDRPRGYVGWGGHGMSDNLNIALYDKGEFLGRTLTISVRDGRASAGGVVVTSWTYEASEGQRRTLTMSLFDGSEAVVTTAVPGKRKGRK